MSNGSSWLAVESILFLPALQAGIMQPILQYVEQVKRFVAGVRLFDAVTLCVPPKVSCVAEVHGRVIAAEGVPAAQCWLLAALPPHSHNSLLRISARSS